MACVDRVAKNGTNETQRYKYAQAADVFAEVRGELAKRFVLLVPNVEQVEWSDLPTKSGGNLKLCTMRVRFDFTDAESGEVMPVSIFAQGSDSGDKAAYKAMTGATKSCLVQTFLIPTGDDPENEKANSKPQPPPPAGAEALKARAKSMPPRSSSEPPPHTDSDFRPSASPPHTVAGAGEQHVERPAHIPTTPPTHDRTATFGFGKSKGVPLADIDEGSLKWYEQCLKRDLADASKSQWHEKTAKQLANLQSEARYRGL